MTNRKLSLIPIAVLFFGACTTDTKRELPKDEIAKTNFGLTKGTREEKPKDALKEVLALKQQVKNSDYRTIDKLLFQIKDLLLKDTTGTGEDENWIFPQLDRDKLVDLLQSIDAVTLKEFKSFEKEYTFDSAPEGYTADSKECPDSLQISVYTNRKSEFTIVLNNRFVVEEMDCAELAIVYTFEVLESGIVLKKIDYAG